MIALIDLAKGQPDYPTPEHIKEAGRQAITDNFTRYTPQPGFDDLREAVAGKFADENGFRVSPDRVVVSCGAKHTLYNVFQCALAKGDEVIIPSPYWFAYCEQVRMAGGVPVPVSCDEAAGFQPDVAAIAAAATDATRMIVINSPCNPTGAVFEEATLRKLADLACRRNLLIVSDETYERIVYDDRRHHSIAALAPEVAARTITVNSVSKTHSMTGWRFGYAAMPAAMAEKVTSLQSYVTSGPCAIAQRAALTALTGPQDHVAEMVAEYALRRDDLLDRLAKLGSFSCHRPRGTFYLFVDVSSLVGSQIRGRDIGDAADLAELLRDEAGVQVSPGTLFGSGRHIRLSFAASRADLQEGVERIAGVLNE